MSFAVRQISLCNYGRIKAVVCAKGENAEMLNKARLDGQRPRQTFPFFVLALSDVK